MINVSESHNYNLVVISMDTPCGQRRRDTLNYTFQYRIVGLPGDETPVSFQNKFKFRPNALPRYKNAHIGCTWTHRLALQLIIDHNLINSIILEDDASLVNSYPPLSIMPHDCAVFLGGCFLGPR